MDHNKTWKILKEVGIPDYPTCLLRNVYADQEATARTGHGTADWFQIGKAVGQGCILSPCLFNFYAEYIRRRQWHPTPVLLPEKSRGWMSLVGCSPWVSEELDMTERLHFHFLLSCIEKEMPTTPVVLPGESQGWRSLMGCRLWGRTELGTTEVT